MLEVTASKVVVSVGTHARRLIYFGFSHSAVQFKHGASAGNSPINSRRALGVLDSCQCLGDTCGRQHTGPCTNRLGILAAGSRWPTRLHWRGDRLICTGCLTPFRKSLTRIRRRRIPAMETTRE